MRGMCSKADNIYTVEMGSLQGCCTRVVLELNLCHIGVVPNISCCNFSNFARVTVSYLCLYPYPCSCSCFLDRKPRIQHL